MNSESLITEYQSYQQEYETKCSEWRTQPVYNRKCNDVACAVAFLVVLGVFIGAGSYYIYDKGTFDDISNLYVYNRAGEIIGCLGICLALSFIYILLIKITPKGMVYFLIAFTMVLILSITILGFYFGQIGVAIPFLMTFIIYTSVIVCWRKKIETGIILIKVATQFLSDKWGIFISPVIKVVLNVLFSIYWIYSLSCILAVFNEKQSKGENTDVQANFIAPWFLIWLLFVFVFYYSMVFTIAVACSFWYYKVEGKNYLFTAYKWLFTSAFGSIVFGSFLIGIVTFAKLIVNVKRRKTKNCAVAICLCLVSLCLKNMQHLFSVLNHNCVIVMAVTGQGYIQSANTTIGIVSRFLGLISVSNTITGLLVFWGVTIITGIMGFISFFWLDGVGASGEEIATVVAVTVFGSIILSSLVFSVLVEAVSSVIIFYCFDVKFKDMGYSSNNMPVQICEALGNCRTYGK